MFVNGNHTPFSGDTPPRKHPLSDATNEDRPAKKRKIQKAQSNLVTPMLFHAESNFYTLILEKEKQKQKAGGKEKRRGKPKGFIFAVTSDPEPSTSATPPSTESTNATTNPEPSSEEPPTSAIPPSPESTCTNAGED